jgi:hypothetical protein
MKQLNNPELDVYHRFIEELNAVTVMADIGAAAIGICVRAVKRAQMVVDGELAPVQYRNKGES